MRHVRRAHSHRDRLRRGTDGGVDVKAASASALEHAREYLEWTALFIAVCRGFQLDKDILRNKEGQVVTQRYLGA